MNDNDSSSNDSPATVQSPSGPLTPPVAPASGPRVINRRSRNPRNAGPPPELLADKALASAMSCLPAAYEFEVHKTIHRIRSSSSKFVALQMPEGLLMYGCALTDLFKKFCPSLSDCVLLGDVTYGACCVDDLGALALGCDLLLHYGHSCLVPTTACALPTLYVFVEIRVDVEHLVGCVGATLASCPGATISVMGTVQFRGAVVDSVAGLEAKGFRCSVPQAKPLSPGEVLGCTAPAGLLREDVTLEQQCMLFIADGRFHLEAAMIANPKLKAYRYDPYSKVLTEEAYEFSKMKALRRAAIDKAQSAKTFGIVLGTLGRQGNPAILCRVKKLLAARGLRSFVVLLSEVFPAKLSMMPDADAWVQIACPRLSIDWGHFFATSVLSTYELEVALGEAKWEVDSYPMDFYAKGETNLWSNYGGANDKRAINLE